MAKVNKKDINRRATNMENGWETEPDSVFRRKTLADLKALRTQIRTAELESEDLGTQKKLKDSQIEDLYKDLDDFVVEVGEGVRGHDDYGNDSELYGSMGFVRKSQRKSGLTRKSKAKPDDENGGTQ